MLQLVAALSLLLLSGPSLFERGHSPLPCKARWERYRIVVERVARENLDGAMRLRIVSPEGRILREVRAWAITSVKTVRLLPGKPEELHISLWSGGAYASFTEVYFTQKGGLRNLLVFNGDSLGVRELRDLNRDGLPEIITENPVLLDFRAYYFHRAGAVITIFGWNGKRYVDVTRRYPQVALLQAKKYRPPVEEKLQSPAEERSAFEWRSFFHDDILDYYANMLAAGEGGKARVWLKTHLPLSEWKWLSRHDRDLRNLIAEAGAHSAYRSQNKVIMQFQTLRRYSHH